MFRNMRRADQILSKEETERILASCSSGVLGVNGDNGYPYTVPLNYVYSDGKIYFHCALDGHKIDSIKNDDKVSFCVIEKDTIVPSVFSAAFVSVIAFGRSRIIDDVDEKRVAIYAITEKFASAYMDRAKVDIEKIMGALGIVEITIEHVTGKSARQGVMIHDKHE